MVMYHGASAYLPLEYLHDHVGIAWSGACLVLFLLPFGSRRLYSDLPRRRTATETITLPQCFVLLPQYTEHRKHPE